MIGLIQSSRTARDGFDRLLMYLKLVVIEVDILLGDKMPGYPAYDRRYTAIR